ncbi:S-layer homology domain-containing protein [Paenibacillus piri]|uniref:SLH domain-containing protein n=1 Tax=Paenibacillus piri TaxID=2547395 RepID=A0A4R5KYD0_9BACL|nr:S-layer homology domain-containing protein [Paenibacillus piri]TDG00236.1 hypothetical protein E1757_00925 [Paenibacillus piri]
MNGRRNLHRWWIGLLVWALLVSSLSYPGTANADGKQSDIIGHWAERSLSVWVEQGRISGYPDGTMRPDAAITRAEWMKLVNRLFSYEGRSDTAFADVRDSDWYAADVSTAVRAGYMSGYGDGTMRPENRLTREEAAVILSRVGKLTDDAAAVGRFADPIAEWSRGGVGAAAAAGWLDGYPDGTFGPSKPITRAEAVVMLDRLSASVKRETTRVFDRAGDYGPATGMETIGGDVIISGSGVTLRNTVVEGRLTIAESVGAGEVHLQGVTVKGELSILGGGENSVYLTDSQAAAVTVNKSDGKVRVVAAGSSSIARTTLDSGAILEEADLAGSGFEAVYLADTIPGGAIVQMSGSFSHVQAEAGDIRLELLEGRIDTLEIGESVKGLIVYLAASTVVVKAVIHGDVTFTGPGTVQMREGLTAGSSSRSSGGDSGSDSDSDSDPGPGPEVPKPATVQAIAKGELGLLLLQVDHASASKLQNGISVSGVSSVTVSVYEPNGADWYRVELADASYDTAYTLQFAEGIALTEDLSPTVSWPKPDEPGPEVPEPAAVKAIAKGELGRVLLQVNNASASKLQEGIRVSGISSVTVSVYELNGADWYRVELANAVYDTAYTLHFAEGIVLAEGLTLTVSWPKPDEPGPEVPEPAAVKAIVKGELGRVLLQVDHASASKLQEGVSVSGISSVTVSVYEPNGADWYRAELANAAYNTAYTLQFAEGIALVEGLSPTVSWPKTVTGLVYSPVSIQLASLGATAEIQLKARWSDGTDQDAASEAVWSSGDEQIATVTGGIVRAVGTGSTRIAASYGGHSVNIPVSVVVGTYRAAVSADTIVPVAGAANTIRFVVKKSDGETDIDFNGLRTIAVSGLEPAPNGSFGNWGGITATAATVQAGIEFTNGVAEAPLVLNGAAMQTLTFSVNGIVQTAAQLTFTVTAANPSLLKIQTQPSGAVDGKTLTDQPVVRIVDAYANPTNASQAVTAVVAGGASTLTGTATINATNGVATFTNLGLNGVSLDVTLSFTGAGLTAVTSDPFQVKAPFSGGEGTESLPYIITLPEQLNAVRNYLSGHFILGADISLNGYAAGSGWEPIGTAAQPFKGTFDGNGHKITELTIHRATSSDIGLFGSITGNAWIGNIGLENVDVEGDFNVGALIGAAQGGTVEDAYAKGNAKSTNSFYTGGLMGRTFGGTIVSRSFTDMKVEGSRSVGGLVGSNEGIITQSYATGTVISNGISLGGLVGENYGTISQSYSRAGVTGGSTEVGGLAGRNNGTVRESYAAGAIASSGLIRGGLIGYMDGSASVTFSYYDQNVTGQNDTDKGTALSTSQMMQQASFVGWVFEGGSPVWGINGSYPYLRWQQP